MPWSALRVAYLVFDVVKREVDKFRVLWQTVRVQASGEISSQNPENFVECQVLKLSGKETAGKGNSKSRTGHVVARA